MGKGKSKKDGARDKRKLQDIKERTFLAFSLFPLWKKDRQ